MIKLIRKGIYQNGKIELHEPVDFEEKVEVLVFFLQPEQKEVPFKPSDFAGLWKDMNVDWEQEIKNMRDEWERDLPR